jgi:hypothetical protein
VAATGVPTTAQPAALVAGTASGDRAIDALERLLQAQIRQGAQVLQQQVDSAAAALAQQRHVAAGPPPTFSGKHVRGIEVYAWLAAMERWFEAAHMTGVAWDAERVVVAASALRDMAQLWWTSQCQGAAAAAAAAAQVPATWAAFRDAITRQYQPQAPERWAMQQLRELAGKDNRDVAVYTARVLELYQLLPNESELSRVMRYEEGLPGEYRVKCAEKQHATLQAATEATLALWNAKLAAGGSLRVTAQLRGTEVEGEDSDAHPGSAVGHAAAHTQARGATSQHVAQMQFDPAQLFAIMMDAHLRKVGGGGATKGGTGRAAASTAGRTGRPRGRGHPRGEGEQRRPRSPGTARLSDAVFRERQKGNLCFTCGGEPLQRARMRTYPIRPQITQWRVHPYP